MRTMHVTFTDEILIGDQHVPIEINADVEPGRRARMPSKRNPTGSPPEPPTIGFDEITFESTGEEVPDTIFSIFEDRWTENALEEAGTKHRERTGPEYDPDLHKR